MDRITMTKTAQHTALHGKNQLKLRIHHLKCQLH